MKSISNYLLIIVTCALLLLILFIRTTRGVDLTDEMQYYAEIRGLIDAGELFSNDLFIQQSVYILFYPIFYLYHLIFGFEGLLFFGRLVMSALSIFLFVYAYRKLVELEFPLVVAALTSFSITFAVYYHGVFAPSYNTVSQMLWIVFVLKFLEWKSRGVVFWGIFPFVMILSHPTSAVMSSFLVLARLWAGNEYNRIAKLLILYAVCASVAFPILFAFSGFQGYLASINFSSGYGVGDAFFSSVKQVVILLTAYILFLGAMFLPRFLTSERLAWLLFISLITIIILLLSNKAGSGYAHSVARALSYLTALAYSLALSSIFVENRGEISKVHWLAVLLLVYATTLGITSSNGIGQATGAFMVGFPILLGIAVANAIKQDSRAKHLYLYLGCVVLVAVLFVAHWTNFPYREEKWYHINSDIHDVSEFKYIQTSQERSEFIGRLRTILAPLTQGRRTLIISEYPALYFALDASPETCMIYMHSLVSDKSEQALLSCLNKKSPEIVIDVLSDNKRLAVTARIKRVMRKYYVSRGFECQFRIIQLNSNSIINPVKLEMFVCKQRN